MENVVLDYQVLRQKKSKIRKNEIQYFIVLYFPFFWQKISVVLNYPHDVGGSLFPGGVHKPVQFLKKTVLRCTEKHDRKHYN